MFWSVYSLSQIFGNLLGAIMFDNDLSKTELHVIMSGVAFIGVIIFAFVQMPFVHRTDKARVSFKLSQSAYFEESLLSHS